MGLTKKKFGRKPYFSKNKNNAFNNNKKPKDKNLGNEIFCFVCGQAVGSSGLRIIKKGG